MNDFETSFELLSTMSPKRKGTKSSRKLKKSPHKLSLKNNIRRSAAFDKVPHSHHVRDSSVIVLDDSIVSEKLSPTKVRIIKAPIIISSTSESENSVCKGDVGPYVNVRRRFADIDTWLSDNEKLEGYSEVYSFKHHSFIESDDEKVNISSGKKKSEDENLASGSWQVVDIETQLGKEDPRTPMAKNEDPNFRNLKNSAEDLGGLNYSDNDIIEESDTEPNHVAESLLDDLYGTSWRLNRDKILSKSETRKPKKRSPVRLPQTEIKPKRTQKTEPKSPWAERLKHLCDSDSSDTEQSTSADSCRSTGNPSDIGRKLSFTDSEDESEMTARKNKKNVSRNSLDSSSNSINFSESENDSLGTRVKKKLAKKAKSITKKKSKDFTSQKTDSKPKAISSKSTSSEIPIKTSKYDLNSEKFSFLKSLSGGIPPWKSHPEANYFKSNYKTAKVELSKKLFNLYNKHIFDNSIPEDTPIQWNDRMRGTAGFCYNRRVTKKDGTVIRSCRIALATKVLDTADRLRDTLVHEMCHAATWLVHNVSDGHGPYWKTWAQKATTVFPELPTIKRCHDYEINTKYTYKCTECGYSIGRHSKSLDIERKRCGYCYGKFDIFINKINKNGEKQTTPAKSGSKPTAFALYVKENYSLVKRNDLKHGDVMKILGQQFSKLKLSK